MNKILGLTLALISPLFTLSVRAETPVPLNNVLAKTNIGSMAKFTQGMTTKIPPQAQSIFGGLTSINCAKGA